MQKKLESVIRIDGPRRNDARDADRPTEVNLAIAKFVRRTVGLPSGPTDVVGHFRSG